MPVLAVDMGGTSIKLGIVHGDELIDASQIPAQAGAALEENLERASHGLKELLKAHSLSAGAMKGIGIALPAIVDSQRQRVLSRFVKYNDAASFDFASWAKDRWSLPLLLENDARAALVGEWQYGAGKGADTIVMLTLGTGVGSAVLMNGKLLRGRHFIAGNLWGHTSVNLHGKLCTCGFTGCLETEASAWVLKEKYERLAGHEESRLSGKDISFVNVFSAAAEGDATARVLLEQCIHAWSVCAVNLVHAYDPQAIIFSGGVVEQADLILPRIQEAMDAYAWLPAGSVKAIRAERPVYSSLLGLGYLVQKKNSGEEV